MGITVVTDNGGVIVSTSQKVISTPPSGWDDQVAAYGRGYNYPQPTGQTTVFRTGDDADIEATIFAPIRAANSLKVQNSLVDFFTLGNNNNFGNTLRHTDDLGTEIYSSGLLIDHYTGLMWNINAKSGVWNDLIDNALSSTLGGFTDWFLPNMNQLFGIWKAGNSVDIGNVYFPFTGVIGVATLLGTSTTDPNPNDKMVYLRAAMATINSISKTTVIFTFECRKHF